MSVVYRTLSDSPLWSAPWTPNDSTPLPSGVRGIMVGTAGNVAIVYSNGNEDVLPLAANTYYGLVFPTRIKATGTTATNIHLLF